jgi:Raf kinase inhibitor-like YbhB/YbcL family protein
MAAMWLWVLAACGSSEALPPIPDAQVSIEKAASLDLRSDLGFSNAEIPARHTCDGEDASIGFQWGDPPATAKSFAFVVDDEVRPGMVWVHWLAWNLPPSKRTLDTGIPGDAPGFVQGMNDFGRFGWGGPCPPKGDAAHTYHARLFALDTTLGLGPDADRRMLYQAMEGHVVGYGEWKGRYARTP